MAVHRTCEAVGIEEKVCWLEARRQQKATGGERREMRARQPHTARTDGVRQRRLERIGLIEAVDLKRDDERLLLCVRLCYEVANLRRRRAEVRGASSDLAEDVRDLVSQRCERLRVPQVHVQLLGRRCHARCHIRERRGGFGKPRELLSPKASDAARQVERGAA